MVNYLKQYGEQMLLEGGFSIVPLQGKKPLIAGWSRYGQQKSVEADYHAWIADGRLTGIGLPAGPANGLCFLDVDSYTPELCEFILQWIPPTPIRRIGAKGFVIPVKYESQRTRKLHYRGIEVADILSDGRQVAALSTHPETLKPYIWHGIELESAELKDLQALAIKLDDHAIDKLEAALNAQDFTLHAKDLAKVHVSDLGAKRTTGRNNALVEQISAAFYKSVPAETTAKQILDYDLNRHSPPLFKDPAEVDTDVDPFDHALRLTYSTYKSNAERMIRDKQSRAEPIVEVDQFATVTIPRFPNETERKKRLNTLDNFEEMFKRLGVRCRYNEVSKRDEINLPGLTMTAANADNVVLAHLTSWGEKCRLPTKNLKSFINAIADKNSYSPIREWIESKPWDGTTRLPAFFKTVTAKREHSEMEVLAMKERLLEVWLTMAVAAAFTKEGFTTHGVLVLLGNQFMGKGRWFRRLLPPEMRKYLAGDVTLDVQSKDSVLKAISHWLVELGELDATIKKSDVAALKAFLTNDKDVIRRPYAACDAQYPRQTVFFASVNEGTYLVDPTGNRRFWTIDISAVDFDHDVDMQQLWAEVFHNWKQNGAKTYLNRNEFDALNEHNRQFTTIEPLEELIIEKFPWDDSGAFKIKRTATQIARMLGIDRPTPRDSRIIAGTLRNRFGILSENEGRKGRTFEIPVTPTMLKGEQPL